MSKVEITHPDKILFSKGQISKQDLVDYFARASNLMLPLIKDRPITMKRYPNGIGKPGFFQKDAPEGTPDWVKTVKVPRKEGAPIHMILCNDKNTLLWMANLGCITPHIWLSKIDNPDYPDRMVFDLDPPPRKSFSDTLEGAFALKELLEKSFKLKTFVTTTGSKGLHVVVPIQRKHHFDEVRDFAKEVVQMLISEEPKKYTLEVRKEKRKGRLFLDVMRNAKGATVMAPYSVRPLPNAPIATPLTWNELRHIESSHHYNIKNIGPRLKKNPWLGMDRCAKILAVK